MLTDAQLPGHYRSLYLGFIRFACIMTLVALTAGILFVESTRKITFDLLGPGGHFEATYHLALVHGHTFLIGVLLPVAVMVMMQLVLFLGGKELSQKVTRWGSLLYTVGAIVAVILMLYKGYHYVISVRLGVTDFTTIEHAFFGGQHTLRAIVYAVSHIAMSLGLGTLAIALLRSLPK